MFRRLLLFLILIGGAAAVSLADSTNGLREINVPTVIGGKHDVLAEHGVPNGMPCDWYAYATIVGLPYCAHPGMDIAVYYQPLYAATDGFVEFAGYDGYYAPYHVDIRVKHGPFDGELHIYGHMSEVDVVTGQYVKRGDFIGISGEAGSAPHLHFERRTPPTDGYPVGIALNPEPVLDDSGYTEWKARAEARKDREEQACEKEYRLESCNE